MRAFQQMSRCRAILSSSVSGMMSKTAPQGVIQIRASLYVQPFKFVVPKIQLFASKPSETATALKCTLFQTPSLGMRNISYTRPCRSIDDFFISNPDVDKEGKMTFPAVGMPSLWFISCCHPCGLSAVLISCTHKFEYCRACVDSS
jgi:hypothetical protein